MTATPSQGGITTGEAGVPVPTVPIDQGSNEDRGIDHGLAGLLTVNLWR